jgi:hypothetical protein
MTTQEIFNNGYGKIRTYKVTEFGMTTEYIKNPNMSVSQIKKAPVYVIDATEEMRAEATANKIAYEIANKEITILEFAKKVAKANKAKITHKSKSGSVYLLVGDKTVRISDHFILDRDAMNPKSRYDLEIVKRSFSENDATTLNF